MLYRAYQAMDDLMAPARQAASAALELNDALGPQWGQSATGRRIRALNQSVLSARITHDRPAYGITEVLSGNRMVPVREEVVAELPFGNLLRFAKDEPDDGDSEILTAPQPRMLVVAPLSGHYATLLRGTVATLLRDHDVYITDWQNARDVPPSAGPFGLEDYVDYVIAFLRELGPRSHVLAVCQPCVPTLAAVAVMAMDKDPCQPRTMTLMGGPVDARVAPTVVNQLANKQSLGWFKGNLITQVPWPWGGSGRRVYPGFLQLTAFMAMNMGRHFEQFRKLYQAIADGEDQAADKIRDFYAEYFAVLDLTEEFYLETIDKVFQRAELATGEMTHRGRKIDCGAIQRTALLTVEGERDDICAVGQTAAAHLLCTSLRPHLKRHHLQPGVGHYGVFSGSKWERDIYPQVRNLVIAMG
ncbi:polyhydroxyalkanoate depolymerase [Novosphingobium flavum]|uniref:Polyhydroxyalkanoate depolymerase n=1 Tax=Novosphingobium flavum TaxID=1778672 RepID=A0A7X1KMR5_9SPHN|nr:polyhydroxyalkanoate depolymerase [Novosphingobium flavum]MBC2666570.1 polyhydroxyalkanoate depolymerase [Novosphingobium flavum]